METGKNNAFPVGQVDVDGVMEDHSFPGRAERAFELFLVDRPARAAEACWSWSRAAPCRAIMVWHAPEFDLVGPGGDSDGGQGRRR